MTTYGLTSTGFVAKTLPIIRAEIDAAFKTAFGQSFDVSDDSAAGEFAGIIAERESLVWELAEAVYNAFDPDGSTNTALDMVCALTGTVREAASASTVVATLTGTPATIVAAASVASVTGTEARFATDAECTIVALDAWQDSTAYELGDRVTNASRCYVCITAGTSAGAGGPTTTSDDITDNTVHWRYMGEGTGAVDQASTAEETGPIVCASGDLIVIETPVSGWSSVINLLDADLGSDIETDAALRVRREEELALPATSTIDGIRAALLAIADVETVRMFVNNTDVIDADGVPPHAFEALIQGGTNQDIFDALLANTAAGIATHGTTAGTADDSEGTAHAQEFTRPSEIDIYVDLTITYDADLYPSDGDDQIEAAIVVGGDAQLPGKDAVAVAVKSWAMGVAGVLDVTDFDIDIHASPDGGDTTVAIAARELAVFDTSRINVTSSAATP
jgi:uncharacterized phage protein gp47/JayE